MTDRPGLSQAQAKVFQFVSEFISENGYGPSYRDVARGVSTGLSHAHTVIRVLIRRGYLVADFNRAGRVARGSLAVAKSAPASVVILVKPDGKYLRTECTGDVTIKVRTVELERAP